MELVIGVLGVVLGGASLIWQAVTHFLTGGRCRAQLVLAGSTATLMVFSTGRMPITLTGVRLIRKTATGTETLYHSGGGGAYGSLSAAQSHDVPCTIMPGDNASWHFTDVDLAADGPQRAYGYAVLGNGKSADFKVVRLH